MSWEVLTGVDLTWSVITWSVVSWSVVATWSWFLEWSLISSPSTFRYWLLGILKDFWLWLLGYRYVPVIIVVVYCLLLFGYNWLWSYLLKKLQKKC